MEVLNISDLTVTRGAKDLLDRVNLTIQKGDKLALIGVNGCGKSTLLQIIAGNLPPDSGSVKKTTGTVVSLLTQNSVFDAEQSVSDHIFSSASPRVQAIREYEQLCRNMDEDSQERLQALMDEIERLDGWNLEKEIREILTALGLENYDLKMGTLSGGMIKKVELAKVLVDDAEILLLDEPTNHLDLQTIVWLENYLQKSERTLLMVTHDRYFLDKVCNSIVEIHKGNLTAYNGNFTKYLEARHAEEEKALKDEVKIKSILRKELEWLRRQPKARGSKSRERINRIMDMVNREKPEQKEEMVLDINNKRLGGKIIELEEISRSYDGNQVISPFSYIFRRGDRIGLMGPNGSGKTTLLNMIAGVIQPDQGDIDRGINTEIGFFRQTNIELPEEDRIIDYIKESAQVIVLKDGTTLSAGRMLERFLFHPTIHHTPVGGLSGGEQRRLYLLKILMSNPNFLILDEPTNDFDIKTLAVLEEFINDFKGCLLLVSHDRYFMDRTVEKLFVIEDGGVISHFPGNCSDYLEYKAIIEEEKTKKERENKRAATPVKKPKADRSNRLSYKEKLELEAIEPEIIELEEEKERLESEMNRSNLNHNEIAELGIRYNEICALLDSRNNRWEYLASKDQ